MSSYVPAPSKGALRALRNLALGTSCTIAFSTGLVTEDRRRRIHSAREVHDNAKRIKSSRKYHSAGASPAPTFKDEVAGYEYFDPLIEGESPQAVRERRSHEPDASRNISSESFVRNQQAMTIGSNSGAEDGTGSGSEKDASANSRLPTEGQGLLKGCPVMRSHHRLTKPSIETSTPWVVTATENHSLLLTRQTSSKIKELRGAQKGIEQLLSDYWSHSRLDAAIAKFQECYPVGFKIPNVDEALLGVPRLLIDACLRQRRFLDGQEILKTVLTSMTLSDSEFKSLSPIAIINGLLKQIEEHPERLDKPHRCNRRYKPYNKCLKSLKAATELFVSPLSSRSIAHSEMRVIGHDLCSMAFRAKLYADVERIYWQLYDCHGDQPIMCTGMLIFAECSQQRLPEAFRHYRRFFRHENPGSRMFYKVTSAVLYPLIEQRKFDQAEEVLEVAAGIAKRTGLKLYTGWMLQLLGERWRMEQDISLSIALFNRIEYMADMVPQPKFIYDVIIQHCVEAGQEDRATLYLQKLLDRSGHQTGPEIRTWGRFALAKAIRHDWHAVERDFTEMRAYAEGQSQEYANAFAQVLKIFAASHTVDEVENFVRLYLETHGVVPNIRIANIMVKAYTNAKEIEAVSKWLAYARSAGLEMTAVTFNTLFHACTYTWHVPFEDLHTLYKSVKDLDENLVDERTLNILRLAAIEHDKAHPDQEKSKRVDLTDYGPPSIKNDSHAIFQRMLIALARGSPTKALRYFTKARNDRIPIATNVVGLAVKAALQLDGISGFDTAAGIIKQSQEDGQELSAVLSPLLSHELSENASKHHDISIVMPQLLDALDQRNVKVSWHTVTRALSTLIDQNCARQALDLWAVISHRKEASGSKDDERIDIVCLSVLLKGFLQLKDVNGIAWVVQHMIVNDVAPDFRFRRQLKNARKSARKDVEARRDSHQAQKWLGELERNYSLVIGERARVVSERKEAQRQTLDIMEAAVLEQVSRAGGRGSPELKHSKEKAADRRKGPEADVPRRWLITRDEYRIQERHGSAESTESPVPRNMADVQLPLMHAAAE